MKRIILAALIASFAAGTAMAQSCESQAIGKDGKALHGAAKTSFMNKCKRDACDSKAISKEGKPLHGAAQNSFLARCKKAA
jgi:opacity protein-like surface antigen